MIVCAVCIVHIINLVIPPCVYQGLAVRHFDVLGENVNFLDANCLPNFAILIEQFDNPGDWWRSGGKIPVVGCLGLGLGLLRRRC